MTTPPAAQPPFRPASVSPEPTEPGTPVSGSPKRSLMPLWITLGTVSGLAIAGVFTYNYYFHASIQPTKLNDSEMLVLNEKLKHIEERSEQSPDGTFRDDVLVESGRVTVIPPANPPVTKPSAPVEAPRDERTLVLTQRELNGILNHNTEFGQYVKVDLKPGYFDVTTIVPVPEDAPFLGGKTLRLSIDVNLKKAEGGDMVLAVRDVSLLGVPLPAAWLEALGIYKGDNLLKELEAQSPFFERFFAGIEKVELAGGEMKVRLAE